MRYFFIDGSYTPKHCIYGPRPREAVFLNHWEWHNISDSLHRSNREKHVAEEYSAKEQNKKQMSFNMTKNWQNTLASIKTQSEQRRIDKKRKDKQDKIDQYNKIVENRKEERIPMLANAKKMLFETKDATRMLTSALVQCSVITEREKQVEFHKFLKEEQARKSALYAEMAEKDVEEFKKEEEKERNRKFEMKKKLGKDLLEQADEKRKIIGEMKNKEREATEKDLMKMKEVIQRLEKCQENERSNSIKRTRMDYEKGYHATELEKSRTIEEDEENEVNRMINKYAIRFEKERMRKEASMIEETIKNRERITEVLTKKLSNGNNKEEIYEKAVREREEEKKETEQKSEELRNKYKSEMEKWAEEHKARVDREHLAREESLKWTILQNERKREIDRAWFEEQKRKERETKANTRADYAKQIKEIEELAKKDGERDAIFLPKTEEDMDDIQRYYEDALEYTQKHEWKNYPLLATLAKIKENYGSLPETQRNKSTKPETQNKRPTGSLGYVCHCFKN